MRREQRCCVTPPRNLHKGKKKASLLSFLHSATWNSPQMGQAPSTILDQENEGHNSESGKQIWKNPSLWRLRKLPTTPGCFPPRPLFLWKHKGLGVQTTVLGSLLLSAKQSSSLIQHHKMSHTRSQMKAGMKVIKWGQAWSSETLFLVFAMILTLLACFTNLSNLLNLYLLMFPPLKKK